MFSAILILLLLPITDVSRSRGMQFRPLSKWAFFVFVANFLILMQLGAKHVESPFIEFGQISTVLYFLYFTVVMYGVTTVENTFVDIAVKSTTPLPTFNVSKSSMDIAILPLAVAIPSFISSFPLFMLCVAVSGIVVLGIVFLAVPGRRCPACLERGFTVWTVPGNNCSQCGTPVH
jgi:hypothetical protein